MHRLFVAIRPPPAIRDLLIDAMDDRPSFAWQDEDQLHLTLRFIGEVERPSANDLIEELRRVRTEDFTLHISGIGRFEHRSGGTIWAAVEPKQKLASLASKIERACQLAGLEPERRAFHPHITLARWKGRRDHEVQDFLERHRGLSSEEFRAETFTLFESHLSRHGATYELIETYDLS